MNIQNLDYENILSKVRNIISDEASGKVDYDDIDIYAIIFLRVLGPLGITHSETLEVVNVLVELDQSIRLAMNTSQCYIGAKNGVIGYKGEISFNSITSGDWKKIEKDLSSF